MRTTDDTSNFIPDENFKKSLGQIFNKNYLSLEVRGKNTLKFTFKIVLLALIIKS